MRWAIWSIWCEWMIWPIGIWFFSNVLQLPSSSPPAKENKILRNPHPPPPKKMVPLQWLSHSLACNQSLRFSKQKTVATMAKKASGCVYIYIQYIDPTISPWYPIKAPLNHRFAGEIWVCLKILYPYINWIAITFPIKIALRIYPIFRHRHMGMSIYGRTLNGRFITYKGKSENNMDDLGVALFLGTPHIIMNHY